MTEKYVRIEFNKDYKVLFPRLPFNHVRYLRFKCHGETEKAFAVRVFAILKERSDSKNYEFAIVGTIWFPKSKSQLNSNEYGTPTSIAVSPDILRQKGLSIILKELWRKKQISKKNIEDVQS